MTTTQRIHRFDARSLVLISAMAVSASAAWAQDRPATDSAADPALVAAFAKADLDGNGKLTKTEAASMPAVAEQFAKLDKDGDGALSQAEFVQGLKSN